jgi:GH43 family beta-xylosidase
MQRFSWNPDGSPAFGVPVANGVAIPVPSGQCP